MSTLFAFDSSAFILNMIDQHWLLIGAMWGLFKIYAKRSSNKIDDQIIELVEDLKEKR